MTVRKELSGAPAPVRRYPYELRRAEQRDLRLADLPANLAEALDKMEESKLLRDTLGHCRCRSDMAPSTDSYPKTERCSWEKPRYYKLLGRAIRWGLGQTA